MQQPRGPTCIMNIGQEVHAERGGTMKKKLSFAALGLAALIAGPAAAADLAVKARPAPPPPVYFSWTGCYFGGNVGGVWVNKELTGPVFGQTFTADDSGVIAGVQAGCNYQFAGGWGVGIPADSHLTNRSPHTTRFFCGLSPSP